MLIFSSLTRFLRYIDCIIETTKLASWLVSHKGRGVTGFRKYTVCFQWFYCPYLACFNVLALNFFTIVTNLYVPSIMLIVKVCSCSALVKWGAGLRYLEKYDREIWRLQKMTGKEDLTKKTLDWSKCLPFKTKSQNVLHQNWVDPLNILTSLANILADF